MTRIEKALLFNRMRTAHLAFIDHPDPNDPAVYAARQAVLGVVSDFNLEHKYHNWLANGCK